MKITPIDKNHFSQVAENYRDLRTTDNQPISYIISQLNSKQNLLSNEFLERELEDRFCFINISDETTADDLERLVTDFTPVTITGQFIQIIKERMYGADTEMKEVLAESLKLGYRLLSGNRPEK